MTTKHINLLDPESAGPGQTEVDYLWILIAVAVLTIACLSYVGWQRYQLSTFTKQLDQISLEVSKLQASASSEQKIALINDSISKTARPISWSNLLKKISYLTPPAVYISQLTGATSEKRKLVLMGNSKTLPAVFTLKEKLSNLPECEKTSISSLNRMTFQIECQIK